MIANLFGRSFGPFGFFWLLIFSVCRGINMIPNLGWAALIIIAIGFILIQRG
jgi:hypothetical protein